jgi:hypothetical protein
LKKTTPVPFESENTRLAKDIIKAEYRYHKWALLNLTLEKVDLKITEVEKQ